MCINFKESCSFKCENAQGLSFTLENLPNTFCNGEPLFPQGRPVSGIHILFHSKLVHSTEMLKLSH